MRKAKNNYVHPRFIPHSPSGARRDCLHRQRKLGEHSSPAIGDERITTGSPGPPFVSSGLSGRAVGARPRPVVLLGEFLDFFPQPIHYRLPTFCGRFSKQTHTGIPGAVFAIKQPAPVGHVVQQNPKP